MSSRTATNAAGPHRSIPTGTIRAGEMYPIAEGMRRAGWGSRTLRKAKEQGLRVLTFGKRSFLLGDDIIAFLTQQPTIERRGGPGRPDLITRRLVEAEGHSQ